MPLPVAGLKTPKKVDHLILVGFCNKLTHEEMENICNNITKERVFTSSLKTPLQYWRLTALGFIQQPSEDVWKLLTVTNYIVAMLRWIVLNNWVLLP